MKAAGVTFLVAALISAATGCSDSPVTMNRADLGLDPAKRRGPAVPGGGDCGDLPTAPLEQRVDLYVPTFAHPTAVTNPLFPIASLERTLLLGTVDGAAFRVEATLLSRTKSISADGRTVEALVSQYVAWIDGRIEEVAIDWYAQDDQGAVWYLGEDVFNYEDGRVADTDGTWLAGRDGPMAMIMPAAPRPGDAWRPENICGFVFEEVTATATGITVPGPLGPVVGGLVTRELHMDGSYEDKTFAPGYGEFSTGSGGNLEALALAIPIDAASGATPDELERIEDATEEIFRVARSGEWVVVAALVTDIEAAWSALRAQGAPGMVAAEMDARVAVLVIAAAGHDAAATRQASIGVARSGLDLALRYEPRHEVDLDHIELWARQLVLDTAARDRAGALSDHVSIKLVRERLARPLDRDLAARIDAVEAAAHSGDADEAAVAVGRLHEARAGGIARK